MDKPGNKNGNKINHRELEGIKFKRHSRLSRAYIQTHAQTLELGGLHEKGRERGKEREGCGKEERTLETRRHWRGRECR